MRHARVGILLVLLASPALFAQAAKEIPVKNWTVPPFDVRAVGSPVQALTLTQGDSPALFVPFGPCRLTDSRASSGGPGPISPALPRNYDFVPGGCPAIAGLQVAQTVSAPIVAWSLNFSVVDTQGPGFLFAYPTGGVQPPVSILNYHGTPGEIQNNAAIVPVNSLGVFTVATGVSATNVIIDANGVFLNFLEPDTAFTVNSNTAALAISGSSVNGVGVRGVTFSTDSAASGVVGLAVAGTGQTNAVRGVNNSASDGSAGVFGSANEDNNGVAIAGTISPAGVRGESAAFGILGLSESIGTAGYLLDAAGAVQAYGWVGTNGGLDPGGAPPWSFFGNQDIGSPGTKSFVEPHATDAGKFIQYIALEGPEAGTYFRGRGRFQNGLATISVPEDFRMVTDPEGLTVQITPIGGMSTFGVLRMGLDEIVVQSSRNLEFSYLVQGVRRAFKERKPMREGALFAPPRADSRIDGSLAPDLKRRLVENGTYNSDGTANLETARRLGWDKVWEKRESPE